MGLNWEVHENVSLIVQYTRTECHANIPANEYRRNLYSAGLELRF